MRALSVLIFASLIVLELPASASEQPTDAGDTAFAENNFELAFTHYQAAAELAASDLRAWRGVARCLDRLGRPNEAMTAWQRVWLLDPQGQDARLRVGQAFADKNRWKDALVALRDADTVRPLDRAIDLALLGRAYDQNGRTAEGDAAWIRAIATAEGSRDFKLLVSAAERYESLDRPAEALECYQRALLLGEPGSNKAIRAAQKRANALAKRVNTQASTPSPAINNPN